MLKYLFLLLPLWSFGQITSYNSSQTGIGNAEVYIPSDKKTHAVIFFTGRGEHGTDKNKIYVNGPMKFIKDGWRPDFIVIGCQSPIENPSLSVITKFITWAVNNLPISGISITGLSYGADNVYLYMEAAKGVQPYAAVPMSYSETAAPSLWYSSTKTWGFCGTGDSFYAKMKAFFDKLASLKYPSKFTPYSGGHSGWNTFYDPKWKDAIGQSIYDYMIPPADSFKVDAGPDETIYFPVDTDTLDLAQPIPSGALLSWSIVSGPGIITGNRINGLHKAATTVRATVVYNGKTYTDDKTIIAVYDPKMIYTVFQLGSLTIGICNDGTVVTLPVK